MTVPDAPENNLSEVDLTSWFMQYVHNETEYSQRVDTNLFPYVLEASRPRWFSRFVIQWYTPVARETVKYFFPLSVDYEALILGGMFGTYIACRHFLDYHFCKAPQFRPGDSLCSGRGTHYYEKWETTSINPKKYFDHDRRLFYRKLRMSLPYGILYGVIGSFFCHGLFSKDFTWVDRHFSLFIGAGLVTYELLLNDKDFADIDVHYNFYRRPELMGLAILIVYSVCRRFRNYSANIPIHRVIIG